MGRLLRAPTDDLIVLPKVTIELVKSVAPCNLLPTVNVEGHEMLAEAKEPDEPLGIKNVGS
jgi:hypothetical protein